MLHKDCQVGKFTQRLIALALLLSGAADYVIFDASDPFASMSAAGTCDLIGTTRHPSPDFLSRTIERTNLPDDGCICCGTAIPSARAELTTAETCSPLDVLATRLRSDPYRFRTYPPPRA